MSKFGTFGGYPKESLMSAEAALLTAWRSLERYHDDLVLVGGLAVHYLTKRDVAGLPGAVTMDVDFGISLAASGEQYGTIKTDLAGLDFKSDGNRLVRKFGNLNLYLDFLTEDPPSVTGTRTVDDVVASVFPGVNRALACRRIVAVKGHDLYGAEQECKVAVADIGPLLVLKLMRLADQRDDDCPRMLTTCYSRSRVSWTDQRRQSQRFVLKQRLPILAMRLR